MPADNDPEHTIPSLGALSRFARRRLKRLPPAELLDAWMFAEAEAALALAGWRLARRADKADAYAVYLAALDREARAARVLELRLVPAGT